MTSMLRIGVLGPLSVARGDRGIPVSRGAAAVIVSVLAAGRAPVTAEQLEETLGLVGHPASRATVHTAVWRLRRALGAEVVRFEDGYLLDRTLCETDVELFEGHVGRGDAERLAGADAQAALHYRSGLELWRGPALPLLAEDPTGAAAARRLEELRASATEAEAACLLATARDREAIARLEQLVQAAPLRERAWALLITALAGAGRRAEAEGVVARVRRLLEEHGLQPGQALHAAMDEAGLGRQ